MVSKSLNQCVDESHLDQLLASDANSRFIYSKASDGLFVLFGRYTMSIKQSGILMMIVQVYDRLNGSMPIVTKMLEGKLIYEGDIVEKIHNIIHAVGASPLFIL